MTIRLVSCGICGLTWRANGAIRAHDEKFTHLRTSHPEEHAEYLRLRNEIKRLHTEYRASVASLTEDFERRTGFHIYTP